MEEAIKEAFAWRGYACDDNSDMMAMTKEIIGKRGHHSREKVNQAIIDELAKCGLPNEDIVNVTAAMDEAFTKYDGEKKTEAIRATIANHESTRHLQISAAEIDIVLDFGRRLSMGQPQAYRMEGAEQESSIQDTHTRDLVTPLIQMLEREHTARLRAIPVDTQYEDVGLDWGHYQREGGDSRFHELFPLDNVEFQAVKHIWDKKETEETTTGEGEAGVNLSHEALMVPYEEINPDLIELFMQDRATIRDAKYKAELEKPLGFDSDDDREFLIGKPRSSKPATRRSKPVTSPAAVKSLAPLVHTHAPRRHAVLNTYTNHSNVIDGTLHAHPQHKALSHRFHDLESERHQQYQTAGDGPKYAFDGTPLQADSCSPSPVNSVPTSQMGAYFQPGYLPYPSHTRYSTAEARSRVLAHSRHSSNVQAKLPQTLASQGFTDTSPIKKQSAMRRAINKPMHLSRLSVEASSVFTSSSISTTLGPVDTLHNAQPPTSRINPEAAVFSFQASKSAKAPATEQDKVDSASDSPQVASAVPKDTIRDTESFDKSATVDPTPTGDLSDRKLYVPTVVGGLSISRNLVAPPASPILRPKSSMGRRSALGSSFLNPLISSSLRADSPAFKFTGRSAGIAIPIVSNVTASGSNSHLAVKRSTSELATGSNNTPLSDRAQLIAAIRDKNNERSAPITSTDMNNDRSIPSQPVIPARPSVPTGLPIPTGPVTDRRRLSAMLQQRGRVASYGFGRSYRGMGSYSYRGRGGNVSASLADYVKVDKSIPAIPTEILKSHPPASDELVPAISTGILKSHPPASIPESPPKVASTPLPRSTNPKSLAKVVFQATETAKCLSAGLDG